MNISKIKLKNIAEIGAGQAAPKEFSNLGYPFIRAGSLDRLLKTDNIDSLEKIDDNIAKKYKMKLYPSNTIVFAKSGMSATMNRVYITKQPSYIVSHLATIITDKVYPKYLLFSLRYFSPVTLIKDKAYPSISLKVIQNHKIVLLEDKNDQIKIANLLTQVEALIAKRKESIELLDELLKSAFLDMFGDPVLNPKGWDKRKLGSIFKVKHGFAFKSEFFEEEGKYVLLTPGNFFENGGYKNRGKKQKFYLGEIPSDYILDKNDILVAMTEQAPGLLGSPLIVPESDNFLHNQRLGLICPYEPIQVDFLFHLFNQKSIRQIIHSKATGIKVRHTSPSKIEDIFIGYPPKSLQDKFATIVQQVEASKKKYNKSLDELHQLFGSLSQRAFKGELALSGIDKQLSKVEKVSDTNVEKQKKAMETRPKLTDSDNNPIYSRDFLWMLLQQSSDEISYDNINSKLKKYSFKTHPNYNQVQTDLFTLIEKKLIERYSKYILWMILQQSEDAISYESINRELEKQPFKIHPDYNQVETDIFALIEEKKLIQIYDDENKKIVLRKQL